jgi:hypothetical protein
VLEAVKQLAAPAHRHAAFEHLQFESWNQHAAKSTCEAATLHRGRCAGIP